MSGIRGRARGSRGISSQLGSSGPPGAGLPEGGTEGQVAKKKSSKHFDIKWDTIFWDDVDSKPDEFPPEEHDLDSAHSGKLPADRSSYDGAASSVAGETVQDALDEVASLAVPEVRNETGDEIEKKLLVAVTDATGKHGLAEIADNSQHDSVAGMTREAIEDNGTGRIQTTGRVDDLDTDGLTPGATLYLGSNGGFTQIRPTSGHIVRIGVVSVAHPSQGSIVLDLPGHEKRADEVNNNGITVSESISNIDSSLSDHKDAEIADAHPGNLPEDRVAFDSTDGHTHDGSNSARISYTDLDDVPGEFTPEEHGNDAHSMEFADKNMRPVELGEGANATDDFGVSVGFQAGIGTEGDKNDNVGYRSGRNNKGDHNVTFGYYAGADSDGGSLTNVGFQAGRENTKDDQTTFGSFAGEHNSGEEQTTVGKFSGQNNTGDRQTAAGVHAGVRNSGDHSTQVGNVSGQDNSGRAQAAFGDGAGFENEGDSQNVLGQNAGAFNTGDRQSAIGNNAGRSNKGNRTLFLGAFAGWHGGSGLEKNDYMEVDVSDAEAPSDLEDKEPLISGRFRDGEDPGGNTYIKHLNINGKIRENGVDVTTKDDLDDHEQTPIADAHPEGQLPASRSSYAGSTVKSALDARAPVPSPDPYPEGATLEKRNGIWQGPEDPHVVTRHVALANATPAGSPPFWEIYDYPVRGVSSPLDAYGQKTSSGHEWEMAPGVDGDQMDGQENQELFYRPDGYLYSDVTNNTRAGSSYTNEQDSFSLIKDRIFDIGNDTLGLIIGYTASIISTTIWQRALCLAYYDNYNWLAVIWQRRTLIIRSVVNGEHTNLASAGMGNSTGPRNPAHWQLEATLEAIHSNTSPIGYAVWAGIRGYHADEHGYKALGILREDDAVFIDNPVKVGFGSKRGTAIANFYASPIRGWWS